MLQFTHMKQVILTGFESFGPYKFNPTQDSTKYFDGKKIGEYDVKGVVLPCTYFGAFEILKSLIDEINPVAILSTGLSSSVRGIRVETTARNIMNGKYADANGYQPKGSLIIEDESMFLNTNCNNVNLVNILFNAGVPAEISCDAEGFICNSLIYQTTNYLNKNNLKIKNAFIHTPWTFDYRFKVELEPGKIMIQKAVLFDSIERIIKNIEN